MDRYLPPGAVSIHADAAGRGRLGFAGKKHHGSFGIKKLLNFMVGR